MLVRPMREFYSASCAEITLPLTPSRLSGRNGSSPKLTHGKGDDPILLDLATSIIAQGKTRVAHNKGERLLPGQMLDDKGRPTTDPKYGVVDPFGALLTFGQHKGFGLSLVCELLGGALAGGLAIHERGGGERRIINGMLTIL